MSRQWMERTGDLLLFAADKNKVVWDVLGALRLELAKQMELLDKNEYKFVWITEFPLLEWNEEENRYTAMHHPFTMPMEEDLQYLDTDPGRVRAKAYDIVLNGNEIGGGSVRIHQNDIQEKMFEVPWIYAESRHMSSLDSFWMHSNTEFRLTPDWLMVLTVWLCSLPRLTAFVT